MRRIFLIFMFKYIQMKDNKIILGLDLGTNSIGWALINSNFTKKEGALKGVGSRIIPMSQDVLGKFDSGVSISQTADRTAYRGVRRLTQRHLLRRERLHRVLNILGFLPTHYANNIDFDNKLGQFKKETKLNYKINKDNKNEFIFMNSFNKMLEEFRCKEKNVKIPLDWTLYYLRKKALTQKISKEELAWIILNFNQKRGYYQLRGEEIDNESGKIEEFYTLRVKKVEETEDKNSKGTWYKVILENDWIYKRQSKESLANWIGKNKEFIITTNKDKDGSLILDKDGNVKRSFRAVDSEKDWIAIKKKTEQHIEKSKKTVGSYIYETLLENPSQKIRGKLVKTIERKFYKDELVKILKEQIKHHTELQDINLYNKCLAELYAKNEAHKSNIISKGFDYLFIDDIIFYQRPLKSKKSEIANCAYESRIFKQKNKDTGKEEFVKQPLKTIPKSHPAFQEFRLWQFLKNLKIYQKEAIINVKKVLDIDVTDEIFETEEAWTLLFDFLNERKEVEQKNIIDFCVKNSFIAKKDKNNYRWNYVEDKKYPCNETRSLFLTKLKKVKGVEAEKFLDAKMEYKLWHIVYSVKDKKQFEKAIENFAIKHDLDGDSFSANFKKIPPFKNDYGSYSFKAINKLLPLMRRGKYWKEENITKDVKLRMQSIVERLESIEYNITKIDENVADDDIPKQLLKSFIPFKNKNHFQSFNTYQACYLVYDRHSEVSDIKQWKSPKDIDTFLKNFKQHSLRNPIVEQVVTETLRTVRDIWKYFGNGSEKFFNEIHIELGREMKNTAKNREAITKRNSINENTNYRIKEVLKELMQDSKVEGDIRPFSPSHQELLKIYEDGIFHSIENIEDEIEKIRKKPIPTKAEIIKYKLWLEQGYISPYTGQMIPLSKLFTTAYQIEHIIPQSRYFDNSLSNKIICESEVNAEKSNKTAFEFIKNNEGRIIDLNLGKNVKLFTLDQYTAHCDKYFKNNRTKLKKLLSEDIPEGFINRQLNDTRYISKLINSLLSNIVRETNEREATSKNIVPVTGAITSKLKQDWGLNEKWNEIIAPRFIRLNELTKSKDFGEWTQQKINGEPTGKKFFRTQVPDSIAKGFNKKRIDHRHHALDAIVIACCTKKHTNYLGSLNAESKNYGLRNSLLIKSKEGHYTKHFLLPWKNFTVEAKSILETTIISFKQNLRVINKTNNKTWQWIEKDGKQKKHLVKQTKGTNWAIRKPMHKETVSGKVEIKQKRKGLSSLTSYIENWHLIIDKTIRYKIKNLNKVFNKDINAIKKHLKEHPIKKDSNVITKIEVYEIVTATATRCALTEKFTRKQLESITDSGIKKILENHIKNFLETKDGKIIERFDLAFNSDGIEVLNKNIKQLNNGKKHHPIYKVRLYEVGGKFNVGETGNKKDKYVEAAKGTNLFFAIYWNEEKEKRVYETIPLNKVIEHQKQDALLDKNKRTPIPIDAKKGKFLFSLSPNDLVYVPTEDEINNPSLVDFKNLSKKQVGRIYKMVSSSGNQCFFLRNDVSVSIHNKKEYSALNKMEKSVDYKMIKNICWKLKMDRIGNILKVIK